MLISELVNLILKCFSIATVEVHPQPAAAARNLLDCEVAVDAEALAFGQNAVIGVDVTPTRLHHADVVRFVEVGDCLFEKIFSRHKIRIEDRHKFALRDFLRFFERARLVALTVDVT